MNRTILVLFVLLSFILGSISNIFGECWHDRGDGYKNYDYQDSHYCEKIGSNFCYFPRSDYETFAPHHEVKPIDEKKSADFFGSFSSKFGGCPLSFSQNTKILRAGLISPSIWHSFEKYCGIDSFDFSIWADLKYKFYFKNSIPKDKYSEAEINAGNIKIDVGGYSFLSEGLINFFKERVDNGRFKEKGIYTLRIDSKIVDDKCTTQEKENSELIDKPIDVFTNLLLKLKLNDNDRIVYDDGETKKIEVNADQDEFYFSGTLLTIENDTGPLFWPGQNCRRQRSLPCRVGLAHPGGLTMSATPSARCLALPNDTADANSKEKTKPPIKL